MEKLLHKYILPVSVTAFVVAAVLFTTQVFAVGKPAGVGQNVTQRTEQSNPGSSYAPQGSATTPTREPGEPLVTEKPEVSGVPQQGQSHVPSFAQVRLRDAKLRACQAISASVTTRSTHLVALVTQMEKTFTSIADGVETYYLKKVVPTGVTLPNYDALVADITTKENAIASLVQTARTDAISFSCTGNNPAAQLTQYRTDMQAVLKGLQDYRTSIKNLIVAVRTLPSENSSIKPSVIPTGTVAPSVAPSITP